MQTHLQIRPELKVKSSNYANDQFENLINPYKYKSLHSEGARFSILKYGNYITT